MIACLLPMGCCWSPEELVAGPHLEKVAQGSALAAAGSLAEGDGCQELCSSRDVTCQQGLPRCYELLCEKPGSKGKGWRETGVFCLPAQMEAGPQTANRMSCCQMELRGELKLGLGGL